MVDFKKALERFRAQQQGGMMDQSQAEEESAMYTTPAQNENEVLFELAPGQHVDCVFVEMQMPSGRMSSPMLHGYEVRIGEKDLISIDESKPIKMWAPRSLEQAYTVNGGRLLNLFVRIRRLEDTPIGGAMFAKSYRVSALKSLLLLLAKDKPSKG